jgi:hypothetical protein
MDITARALDKPTIKGSCVETETSDNCQKLTSPEERRKSLAQFGFVGVNQDSKKRNDLLKSHEKD